MKPSDITLITAPVGRQRTIKGQKVHVLNRSQLADLSQALRKDTMEDYVKKYPGG